VVSVEVTDTPIPPTATETPTPTEVEEVEPPFALQLPHHRPSHPPRR
jgi:hypothetical protein